MLHGMKVAVETNYMKYSICSGSCKCVGPYCRHSLCMVPCLQLHFTQAGCNPICIQEPLHMECLI
jgi:hypothetical protein